VRLGGVLAGLLVTLGVAGCSMAPETAMGRSVELPPATAAAQTTAAGAAPTATAAPAAGPSAKRVWWSGASGTAAFDGSYGTWRRAALTVAGTWDNGNDEQVTMKSVCPGGEADAWKKPLDVAVGAIDQSAGETWAAAAGGAYDARWTKHLLKLKQCWGSRSQANLYLRFAHEMNLGSMPWHVKKGDEANFVKAITRYSTLRYKYLPKAKVVLCPSDGTDWKLDLDVRDLWPGKDPKGRLVANVYAIDTYNGYVVVKTPREFTDKLIRFGDKNRLFGMETHRAFAEQMGVPFAVSEWSNNGDPKDAGKGGEAPVYVQLMNAYFREHSGDPAHPRPGQLLYEIQFNLLNQFVFLPSTLQPKTAAKYRSLKWGR
jgi:hypothetical protein